MHIWLTGSTTMEPSVAFTIVSKWPAGLRVEIVTLYASTPPSAVGQIPSVCSDGCSETMSVGFFTPMASRAVWYAASADTDGVIVRTVTGVYVFVTPHTCPSSAMCTATSP